MNGIFTRPTIETIYSIPNNDSLLNITFKYPSNNQFTNLTVNFTIYDFRENNLTNPLIYTSAQQNLTITNGSYPWLIPDFLLQSGSYIIICFQWIQTNSSEDLISDTYQCTITRAPMNGLILPIDNTSTSVLMINNTILMISGLFPKVLPFDQVNTTAILNDTIIPLNFNVTSNENYSNIQIFTFAQLVPDTYYRACIQFRYSNSKVRSFEQINEQCQVIKTLYNYALINSYNQFLVTILLIILFFLFISI